MEQLLLNIKLPIQKTLDNFIVGNNKECFDSLHNFILPDNDIFFIYIWGEKGCGKSHLAEAINNNNITVVEDIDQANNTKQIKIFNLYNEHKIAQKKLLVTGSNNPNKMMLRDDLASRLSWGLVYKINLLSDIEKKLALNQYSKERGLNLKIEIIEYLLRYYKRDLHSLIATLDALDRWSLKTKRSITIPLLKEMNQIKLFK
ncbi:DnaA/Hda family protein [Methylophilaceae bacterium]|jgi:DnaA family protein|nr:DnaA/Hda family protein [Methylophilaceae bacterium]|tara:strand:- start:5825 stop:6430 length:606 start_codon:yes stop_codon:yes gene_type:complete